MGAIPLDESDKRNSLRNLVPASVYGAVIGKSNNVVIKVIVLLNEFGNCKEAVAGVGVAMGLEFVGAPLIPIDSLVGVGNYVVFLAICECRKAEKLKQYERAHKRSDRPFEHFRHNCTSPFSDFYPLYTIARK